MEYKCEVCGHGKYLVFVMSVKDMVCEGCGAWQDAELESNFILLSRGRERGRGVEYGLVRAGEILRLLS
jgi:hypothetical protein